MRTAITFPNAHGATLNGWLYHDLGHPGVRLPAIVMPHENEPSKAQDLDDCAMTFGQAGFVVLVYSGHPLTAPRSRRSLDADRRPPSAAPSDALTYVRSLDFVDPHRVHALALGD
jgi:dipeptidyl aminopeptidase/acylaminoacyl peptidase